MLLLNTLLLLNTVFFIVHCFISWIASTVAWCCCCCFRIKRSFIISVGPAVHGGGLSWSCPCWDTWVGLSCHPNLHCLWAPWHSSWTQSSSPWSWWGKGNPWPSQECLGPSWWLSLWCTHQTSCDEHHCKVQRINQSSGPYTVLPWDLKKVKMARPQEIIYIDWKSFILRVKNQVNKRYPRCLIPEDILQF